jgi:hypothetical protein
MTVEASRDEGATRAPAGPAATSRSLALSGVMLAMLPDLVAAG